ncbi:hypothetical protein BK133_13640 [Paenibacillus sp. FSL H8-0548]|uniref:CCA tRNA nucleotidyltransferase n=1 Tax=Paenibacillus sp. FSL H8-0548 TaxID=1920422 RepID=UPI00096BD1EB|nr:CCA tRNA nucleotidyltransferase [Paenibacillus sp. FSL H8-0548]OMF33858.1 hypothetical protein BK133_13640 [Paenibacillus sp. FSL H8-0548]
MRLPFPEPIIHALPIVRRLREQHFEAVFVGGAVRDTVLGLAIKDVDIATSARPEQVLELFERCIPTGLQHGTITVIYNELTYEVTTFRLESIYEDHRKPERVQYITELDSDLLRRDFTMNAMALGEDGELYDPYGGVQDLMNKKLRSVGDPNARFQEDALRMLRAVRFIGVYQLVPVHDTWRAILRHRTLLKFIALERVQVELDKMLAGTTPLRALHFVAASGLLFHLKESFDTEIELSMKKAELTTQSKKMFRRLHELKELDQRWAAIVIGLELSTTAVNQALKVLRFSNSRSKRISTIIQIHNEMVSISAGLQQHELQFVWIEKVIQYGKRYVNDWLDVIRMINEQSLSFPDELLNALEIWLEQMFVSTLKELQISGKELTSHLNRQAGPWVSERLNRLLIAVAAGELKNEEQALLAQAALWE